MRATRMLPSGVGGMPTRQPAHGMPVQSGRRRYAVAMAAAIVVLLATGMLAAQEHSDEKQAPARQNATGEQNAEEPRSQQTTAEQLAAATNKAAGPEPEKSEDENAQFKQSPSVKMIARWLGVSAERAYLISVLINFAIVAGLVGWGLKKMLPTMFSQRTAAIQKGMEEARRASEDANQRLREIEDKLSRLDADIAQLRATATLQGDEEEARQKRAAEGEQRRMIETAEQEINAAANAARRELKAYSAELAVSLAEKQIKVDAATDQELVRDFVDQLGRNGRP